MIRMRDEWRILFFIFLFFWEVGGGRCRGDWGCREVCMYGLGMRFKSESGGGEGGGERWVVVKVGFMKI